MNPDFDHDDDHVEPDIGPFVDQALVLNKNWTPVATTTVRRALVLLCRSTASAICPASYEVFDLLAWIERSIERAVGLERHRVLRTPSFDLEKPEVILLRGYAGIPRRERLRFLHGHVRRRRVGLLDDRERRNRVLADLEAGRRSHRVVLDLRPRHPPDQRA